MSDTRIDFNTDVELMISMNSKPELLVTVVELPAGALETIVNTTELESKINYLQEAYDDDFRLKANNKVRVVGYILI